MRDDGAAVLEAVPALLQPVQAVLFVCLLVAVSVRDLKERKIPDRLQIGIAALAVLDLSPWPAFLLWPAFSPWLAFSPWNLAGLLCMLPYRGIALRRKGENRIGGGDVKLAGSTGLVLGLPAALTASILGLSAFVLYGTGMHVRRRMQGKVGDVPLPLGPFLAAGCILAYFMKMGGQIR